MKITRVTQKCFSAIVDIPNIQRHWLTNMRCAVYRILRTLFIFLALAGAVSPLRALEFKGTFPSGDYPFTVKDSGVEVVVDKPVVVEWLDEERQLITR